MKKLTILIIAIIVLFYFNAYADTILNAPDGIRTGAELDAGVASLCIGLDDGTNDYYATFAGMIDWLELTGFTWTSTHDFTSATVTLPTELQWTSQAITTDADPYTITFTADYREVLDYVTTHADNVNLTISETGANDQDIRHIYNLSANTLILENDDGVVQIGSTAYIEQYNWVTLQYWVDRWVCIGSNLSGLVISSLQIPYGTNPSTTLAGHIASDTDDASIETYSTRFSASVLIAPEEIILPPLLIYEPDEVDGIEDEVPIYTFLAEEYPHGAVIRSIHIWSSATCTDALNFEEHSNNGTAWSNDSTVEAITLSGIYTQDDGTLTDAAIAADATLFCDLADAMTDIAWIKIQVTVTRTPGD